MPIIHQPHDKFFKLSMAELAVALEFFTAHLPLTILKKIDLTTLKFENHSFIDEAYKATEADVVYSVKMGETTAYLYLLCEHQSEPDPQLAFRLLIYTVRIMSRHLQQHRNSSLPVVYPIVVYTGDQPWDAPMDIFPLFGDAELLAREVLFKPYQLMDVNRIADDELRKQQLSGLVAFALKHRQTNNFKQFLEKLLLWINEVETASSSGDFLSKIVLQYVVNNASTGDKNLLLEESKKYPTVREEIMTIAQQWKEEGMQLGVQQTMSLAQQWKEESLRQGVQQGVQQGEAALIIRLIQRRFGEIPATYKQRINEADAKTLLLWAEKILDAAILDDIFAESFVSM